ncbi:hypothetical protein SCG7109_BF_00010, partial [Chlamydiales bacterium SCGC AG-110-M15]
LILPMLLKLQSCHEQLLSESKDSIFELLAPTLLI